MSWNYILRKALGIYVVIATCLAGTAMARTLYVDASVATTTGDGSLASPFKTIGAAITASAAGDEIRIAGGTYATESPYMALKNQLTVSGSYNSTFTLADFAANPTIIDMAAVSMLQQNCTFRCQGITGFVMENLVIKNGSTGEGGNTNNGGALYVRTASSGTLRHVSFINCATKFEGGVVSGPARDGGAICIRDGSTLTLEDCVFDGCTAVGVGGAICMRSASGAGNNVTLRRCLFTNCGSRGGASAIHDKDTTTNQLEVDNCIFAHNGVDVAVPSGTAPSHCEIQVTGRQIRIYNCTFVGSNCPDGFVFNLLDSTDASATKEIVNCIIANNTIASGGTVFAIFSYATGYNDATTLQNNLFFSNSGAAPLNPAGAAIIGANGNVAGDPQFADAATGDYHLKAGSPGENAGQTLALVPDDFAGTARPVGSAYDIGALEGQAPAEPASFKVPAVTATASSSLSATSGPEKTVDGSGLNALDQHDTASANMWTSAAGQKPPVWIQYQFDNVYKLDQMWVWNSNNDLEWLVGWGVKTATIEYSSDGATWTALPNVPQFAQAPGAAGYAHNTTVDFGGVVAKFVRLTPTSSWGGGGQYGLSEVRFFYFPVTARNPKPANGATDVPLDTTLSWRAGRDAASHKVYLGTDPNALTLAGTVSDSNYAPAGLLLGTKYYWRVDEVNAAATPSTWTGDLWSFTAASYLVIDDMESYNDTTNKIFDVWVDGYGTTTNGSQVGLTNSVNGTFGSTAIHRGGRQSMPFTYGNGGITTSEATRAFTPAQDWTQSGANTLTLFFYGNATNTAASLYVKINGTKISYSGDAANVSKAQWTQWDVDLSALPASTRGSVKSLTIGAGSGSGTLFIDDIRLR